MNRISMRNRMPFAATATALLLAASAAPFLAHAQSSSANDVIQLVTGEGSVKLQTSEDSFCTATSSGQAIAVSVGDRCSSFGTSADIPAPLYVKIAGDQMTFRDGGRSYVVRDASVISSARVLFAPFRDITQRQSDLGRQMGDLGASERESAHAYQPPKVNFPDLTADFQKVEADAKRLSAEGGTQSQLSELQSELSELQNRISEMQAQASEEAARVSEQKSQSSLQMETMSQQMNALSEQMKTWSRQGEDAALQAAKQVKMLLDQAIANGAAKPE
jgi:chemotaxis protein histidine kinase CheA